MKRISINERCICTKQGCMNRAKWWIDVRVNGLDEQHARCDEHAS